jgi:transcriptional regulator with XRE-family HTH domain
MQAIVRQLMEQIRTRVGKDAELVVKIAPLIGHTYSAASVSGWRRGHDRMPAEVLLAACQVTGVSIDELLFGQSVLETTKRVEKEWADFREEVRQALERQRLTIISEEAAEVPNLGQGVVDAVTK